MFAEAVIQGYGNIAVCPGDRISLVPRHTGHVVVDYDVNSRWNVVGNVIATAGSYLHGDENNANQAGGTNEEGEFVSGSSWISGYTVVNLQSTYVMSTHAQFLSA